MIEDDFFKRYSKNNEFMEFSKEFDEEIENNSDRGIVLICGSIIENVLQELLKTFLINSPKLDSEMFKGNAPLSSFDARIKMAYYLGLITKNALNNLVYLQRVRNKFAHQVINMSFNNTDIKNICSSFSIPKNCYVPKLIPLSDKKTGKLPIVDLNPINNDTLPKDRFLYTFKYLFVMMINEAMWITGDETRREKKEDLTADKAILRGIQKFENILAKIEEPKNSYEEVLNRFNDLDLSKVTQEELDDFQKDLQKLKENVDEHFNKNFSEKYLNGMKLFINIQKYSYDVVKNSIKD